MTIPTLIRSFFTLLRPAAFGVLVLGTTGMLGGCTTNPATGRNEFTPFMSPSQERQVGKDAHQDVVRENGGIYNDPKLAGYVAAVGGRLAANSEMKDLDFTFTLLDTSLVNAFALPGGYVYITRGILAQFNSEAELASVLGHEIGHVTARHTAKRYNRQMFAGILGAGLAVATQNAQLGNLMNYGSQLYLLGYSRDQEYQADGLGIRYLTRAGYDPYASADMLHILTVQDQLQTTLARGEGRERPPEFFSTHPSSKKREARAVDLARKTGLKPGEEPRLRNRFLDAIDGMIYGDSPDQGFIRGTMFWHPVLKLTFTVPEGFRMMNSSDALVAQGPDGAAVLFSGGEVAADTSTESYLLGVWKGFVGDLALQDVETVRVNGMDGVTGSAEATSTDGAKVTVRAFAIRYDATHAYHFLMIVPTEQMAALSDGLKRMTYSFRKLTDQEAREIKPRRIHVITVAAGDTVASLSERMDYPDFQVERFLALNGLAKGAKLTAGTRVKLIISQ